MKVFWIEGLPGSGKTVLINSLCTALGEKIVFFPKMDVPAIFKNANFDYRPYFSPDYNADLAVEKLKIAVLNGAKSNRPIISERSYISTCVYYSILHQEKSIDTSQYNVIIDSLMRFSKKYDEYFIYLECGAKESLARDTHVFSGFWHNTGRIQNAKLFYKMFLNQFSLEKTCIIPAETPDIVLKKVKEFIFS